MSLPKDTLQHIIELAAAASGNPETDFPIAAMPSGMQIHDLEEYQKRRNMFRGKLSTHSVADFLTYVNLQAKGACFVDSRDMYATAYFDIGTIDEPGHCRHQAHLRLKETAAYSDLVALDGRRIGQVEMADFIEDWADNINTYDDAGEALAVQNAVHAIRNVTIDDRSETEHGIGSFSQTKSSLEQLDASSKGRPLPGMLKFTCVPFLGLANRTFRLKLRMVIRRNQDPEFICRIVRLDDEIENMNEEFFLCITKELHASVHIYNGSFSANG